MKENKNCTKICSIKIQGEEAWEFFFFLLHVWPINIVVKWYERIARVKL